MTKRQNNDHVFLYWDEYEDLKKSGTKMNGREEVAQSEREDTLIAMEGNRFYKGKKLPNVKYKRKSRVNDLFAQFEKLSRIEKDNFINLIRNYITHG